MFDSYQSVSSKEIQRVRRLAKRVRAALACARCKSFKVKCSDYRPCKQCNDTSSRCDNRKTEDDEHNAKQAGLNDSAPQNNTLATMFEKQNKSNIETRVEYSTDIELSSKNPQKYTLTPKYSSMNAAQHSSIVQGFPPKPEMLAQSTSYRFSASPPLPSLPMVAHAPLLQFIPRVNFNTPPALIQPFLHPLLDLRLPSAPPKVAAILQRLAPPPPPPPDALWILAAVSSGAAGASPPQAAAPLFFPPL